MNVEEVFKAAPGCQKVLMTALKACRTPRTPSELDSIMDEVLRCNRSVYRPAELRALLGATARWRTNPARKSKRRKLPLKRERNPNLPWTRTATS